MLLNQAKRLWKDALQDYSPQHILKAAKAVIEQSDYLPTLQKMLSACDDCLGDYGLPDVRQAYLEAANAPSPKNAQDWSHPIVYLAGKTLGWYAMSHAPENVSYPAFAKAYRDLARRLLAGEVFEIDAPPQLSHQPGKKADLAAIEKELQELHRLLSD